MLIPGTAQLTLCVDKPVAAVGESNELGDSVPLRYGPLCYHQLDLRSCNQLLLFP